MILDITSFHHLKRKEATDLAGRTQAVPNMHRPKLFSRGGGLGSSTIFKNLMSPTPRRKWYLTTRRRLIKWYSTPSPNLSPYIFLGLNPSPPPLLFSQTTLQVHWKGALDRCTSSFSAQPQSTCENRLTALAVSNRSTVTYSHVK